MMELCNETDERVGLCKKTDKEMELYNETVKT